MLVTFVIWYLTLVVLILQSLLVYTITDHWWSLFILIPFTNIPEPWIHEGKFHDMY